MVTKLLMLQVNSYWLLLLTVRCYCSVTNDQLIRTFVLKSIGQFKGLLDVIVL